VIGDQQTHATVPQLINQLLEIGNGNGIHTGEWFIQE
jgi:hypothetical protein